MEFFLIYWFICVCVFLYHLGKGSFSHLDFIDKIIMGILSFVFMPFFIVDELSNHN